MYPIEITSTQKTDVLEIRWMPHNICNFKCRYCFPGSFEGTDKAPSDVDLVINNFNHLINHYKDNGKKQVHIKILGGEPTLYKGLETFIRAMKDNHNAYITIVSNGSRNLRWWQDNGDMLDNVVLSYHVAQADIFHHLEVADLLYEKGKKVTSLVLMDPTIWYECVRAIEDMKQYSRNKWMIQAKELVEWGVDKVQYTPAQKKYLSNEMKRYPSIGWILKNIKLLLNGSMRLFDSKAIMDDGTTVWARPHTYINKDWINFKGWSCDVGLDCVFIDSKGNIKGACGQTIYNLPTAFNILDTNFDKKFKPELTASVCAIEKCTCQPDTHISKFNLSNRNVGGTRTIIPITDYRVYINTKCP
jgi:organic radical activating enzyme